ncbi:hypothetical protein BpHYR1_004934 [Brachionus plicatilis]|uniref:Uncharacterized protein n=1 Tax=Brachionus plicatilis TaxID=10195 RepID=A0A3M7S1E4_BRAPC|nr:hypothetical protein BpHYR1_004934 [Brachionus plicatilis]
MPNSSLENIIFTVKEMSEKHNFTKKNLIFIICYESDYCNNLNSIYEVHKKLFPHKCFYLYLNKDMEFIFRF